MARKKIETPASDGRFAYEGLERAIHEKARLGILTSLLGQPQGLAFGDLKELCALTDGNLNRHLAVLQEAGLVEVKKTAHRRRPQTTILMTPAGRRRFQEYIHVLETVVADALKQQRADEAKRSKLSGGWSPA